MKHTSTFLASFAAFALAQAGAQTLPSGPFTQVTQEQYNQAVQSGKAYVISPTEQADENKRQQAIDAKNRAIVNGFISQHPELSGLAALVAPSTNPAAAPTGDGNYMLQIQNANGGFDSVETMGSSTALASLADSILASTDPVQQLALYQTLYSQYVALYNRLCGAASSCNNLVAPSKLTSPALLQNASIGVIKSKLKSLSSLGPELLTIVPVVPLSTALSACSAEIGASLMANNATYTPGAIVYGDQTNSSCTAKKDAGILKNFTWPNEDLLTCVKKQGARGTCHIFAATSAIEELIARDTGNLVNLSEQDFNEFVKLGNSNPSWGWSAFLSTEGGNPRDDLKDAAKAGYQFAYEYQWDYNPAYGRNDFTHICDGYPTLLEPGCSNSAPEAPESCFSNPYIGWTCLFTTAALSGARSPYGTAKTPESLWDDDGPTMLGNITSELAAGSAVVLSFGVTDDFTSATSSAGYVKYNESQDSSGQPSEGYHAVHIVGYVGLETLSDALSKNGESIPVASQYQSKVGYFIIKNSWGTCAGDLGYYYMPYEYLIARATHVYAVKSETH